jgi:hypothetical protein
VGLWWSVYAMLRRTSREGTCLEHAGLVMVNGGPAPAGAPPAPPDEGETGRARGGGARGLGLGGRRGGGGGRTHPHPTPTVPTPAARDAPPAPRRPAAPEGGGDARGVSRPESSPGHDRSTPALPGVSACLGEATVRSPRGKASDDQKRTTSVLTATTLTYAIRAGITAGAGTRLVL